jgi:hypothetical protein
MPAQASCPQTGVREACSYRHLPRSAAPCAAPPRQRSPGSVDARLLLRPSTPDPGPRGSTAALQSQTRTS